MVNGYCEVYNRPYNLAKHCSLTQALHLCSILSLQFGSHLYKAFSKYIKLAICTTVIILLSGHCAYSQISNVRERFYSTAADTLRPDTLSMIQGSLVITSRGREIPAELYRVNYIKSEIILLTDAPRDSVNLSYRVLPVFLGKPISKKSTELIQQDGGAFKPYIIGSNRPIDALYNSDGIDKSGSISRGILFGNNQNLSVNSTLNLQLSGKLNERYSLLASVTDDNIPIQPQGNTQQLQDFDQVFIQIYDDNNKLIAGDFILKKPQGYFMQYFKRAQGAYVLSENSLELNNGEKAKLSVEASASISKGRFARNQIQGIEGNQGPYRLQGADNELFIIVLAGTEQVYIDGRLLQRGQDKDYVIDYNAAEIVFTPRQFITKDRRIVVEFQYSEKRYARPLLQSSIRFEKEKNKFYLNVYSENDAKNQPLQQDLTDDDKRILSLAGDNLFDAFKSGIDSVAYSNNLVLYAMTDSLGYDSVFVFTTDSTQGVYRLTFSPVGTGNGDYVEDGFTANGKKYKWVAPVQSGQSLIRQGSFAPIILLATPKKNQMITAGFELDLTPKNRAPGITSQLNLEGAMSNRDLNTFSSVDSGDDIGFGVKTKFITTRKGLADLPKEQRATNTTLKKNSISSSLNYEYTGKNFAPIERFREVEFARNWNILSLALLNDQHIAGADVSLKKPDFGLLSAGAELFQLGNSFSGYKGKINTAILTPKHFKMNLTGSYLSTSGLIKTQFIRHKSDVSKQIKSMRIYYRDEHEYNLFYAPDSDSLTANSYQFFDWEVGVGTADTLSKSFTVYYRDRIDRKPATNDLSSIARADQYGALLTLKGKKDSRLNINISNRRLRVIDPELFTQQPENTLLTRLEYNVKWKEGFVQSTTFFEVGSGLEQRREFIYLEVPAGQGLYVWNDYNNDGVKDLQEFEIARFGYEANYIRSSVQSNDYERTYTNQFSQSLVINPARILKKQNGFNKFVSRFTNQTSFRTDRKTTRRDREEAFNPFLTSIADSALLALNGMIRNVVFFNKSNPAFGLDYTWQRANNKNLLSNGFESREDSYQQIGLRWNFYKTLSFFTDVRSGEKIADSDFLSGRNFRVVYTTIQPRLTWQPNTSMRLNLNGQASRKENTLGSELATIRKIGADMTFNSTEKGSLQAEVSYFKIDYNSTNNSSLAFEMLEGLTGGNNFTWSATIQRTVAKNLQLNLTYNGRKPEDVKTIHSGGVQLRAFF